ncbi:YdeI/OmpD-associated family protein [Paucibacter sp. AS339]|uniref:YdeI/OmpD-associated family protein n=1 Tax=Paucibacter hankyongi TaxID=3133434 RepID=UPI0030AFD804
MKHSPSLGEQFSFDAVLEDWAEGLDYCAVPVPAQITQALGTKGPILVLARVNDSNPFQVSLFPVGGGQHYVRVKARIRKETNTKTGDRIRVQFTVLDRDSVEIPDALMIALRTEGLTQAFQSLPPGKQNFIIRRIGEAAKPDTRARRIQEGVLAAHQRQEKLSKRTQPITEVHGAP